MEWPPLEAAREDHVRLGLEDVRRRLDPVQDPFKIASVAGTDLDQVVRLAVMWWHSSISGIAAKAPVRSVRVVPGAWVIQLKARMS